MAFNILIVDDSETVRAVIAKTLRLARVPVNELHEAGNGREALEVLGREWIDLVLTDINMPEMNGLELVDRMQQDGLLEATPVVVVSTEGSSRRIDELKGKGVTAYLRKPFTPEALGNLIGDVMGAVQ